ncbi:MAG: tripartite tricarboxylate transporter TctB family protein [Rhodospirillales bacterium]
MSKDFIGGTLLVLIGLAFALDALQYGIGTALRMGAGFFPLALGLVIVLLGTIFAVSGLRRSERIDPVAWRSVAAVTTSLCSFALLVDIAGLIPALASAVMLAALGDKSNNPRAIVGLVAFCCVLAWLIFVVGLGSPAPLFGHK